MLVEKIMKRRNAVSPVIAAILLIGLTVAAGAVVYFLVFSETDKAESTFTVTATTSQIKVTVSNSGAKSDKIGQVVVTLPGTHSISNGTVQCSTTGDNPDSNTNVAYTWNDLDYAIRASETGTNLIFVPTTSGELFGGPGDEITVAITFDESGLVTKTGAL
jgi:flagellin-like protein